jgi:hypothetical protein
MSRSASAIARPDSGDVMEPTKIHGDGRGIEADSAKRNDEKTSENQPREDTRIASTSLTRWHSGVILKKITAAAPSWRGGRITKIRISRDQNSAGR